MILIPQRLFENKEVKTILRDGNVCILEKKLTTSFTDREGYISNHVIAILLSGEQKIKTYNDEIINIQAGEILFIPRGVYYITDLTATNGLFHSLLFYFDDAIIQDFLSNVNITKISKNKVPGFLKFNVIPSIELFATSLIDIYTTHRLKDKSFLDLKILELMHLLNSLVSKQQFAEFLFSLTLPKKRNIKTFIQQNFDKPLKIEDYAYLTGRSVSTFRRDFKAQFDTTPQAWIKQKRMEKALSILEDKKISVTQLAYEVGYENISYFIKEFKSHVGLSPKQYMLSQHKNNLLN